MEGTRSCDQIPLEYRRQEEFSSVVVGFALILKHYLKKRVSITWYDDEFRFTETVP